MVAVLFVIPQMGCWGKQDHSINAPEVPLYKLWGFVRDIDTGRPLSNCTVSIEPKPGDLLYDWIPSNPSVLTDTAGYYEIKVCPGNYTLYSTRENAPVFEKKITIYYSDREYPINLPNVNIAAAYMPFSPINGLCINSSGEISVASLWLSSTGFKNRIATGLFANEFAVLGSSSFHPENPPFKALVFIKNLYLSFTGTLADPEMVEVNVITGRVERKVPAIHRFNDFAFDGTNIWATGTNRTIYKMEQGTYKVLDAFPSPDKYPTGITWTGATICSFDSSSHLLYKHNDDMSVQRTTKLFYINESNQMTPIKKGLYLGYGPDKHLLVAEHDKIFKLKQD